MENQAKELSELLNNSKTNWNLEHCDALPESLLYFYLYIGDNMDHLSLSDFSHFFGEILNCIDLQLN